MAPRPDACRRFFDFDAFAGDLFEKATKASLTLPQLSDATGVIIDSLVRLRARTSNLSIDPLVTLAGWAELDLADYIRERDQEVGVLA